MKNDYYLMQQLGGNEGHVQGKIGATRSSSPSLDIPLKQKGVSNVSLTNFISLARSIDKNIQLMHT